MLRLRPLLALLSLALVVPFAACGDGNDPVALGANEGVYVTTGGLKYQVQMSRKLNPYDVEDRDYLEGIKDPAGQVANKKFAWFGVFIRVENRTGKNGTVPRTIFPARVFSIEDNEGTRALPYPLPASNVFAYRAFPIRAKGVLPTPDSAASTGPIGGALILFKVDQQLLERRPVLLRILSPNGTRAAVRLDI